MKEVYIVFVDDEDGMDRESWSVFYTDRRICASKEEAERQGQLMIDDLNNDEPDVDYVAEIHGPYTVYE